MKTSRRSGPLPDLLSSVADLKISSREGRYPCPERRTAVSPLRQRMIQDMPLRGFSARTQECYVAAVRQLSEHYHASPDQLTEEA